MNVSRILLFSTTMFAILAASVCYASESKKGGINWTEGFIEAVGQGTAKSSGNRGKDRINAVRAAQVSAQRALLESIKGVHVTSMTTVEDSMLKEDIIRTKVSGIVKGAAVVSEKVEWEDNSPVATVIMRICLSGGFNCKGSSLIDVLELEKKEEPPFVPQKKLISTPLPPEPPAPVQPAPRKYPSFDTTKPVTGVVIALDGRNFEHSLLPVVVTKANSEMITVYSAKIVKPSVIRTYGAVRYADSVDNALKNPQLGGNVMVLPSVDVTRENMIVIDSRDAAKLKETLTHGNDYLAEAKVVISTK